MQESWPGLLTCLQRPKSLKQTRPSLRSGCGASRKDRPAGRSPPPCRKGVRESSLCDFPWIGFSPARSRNADRNPWAVRSSRLVPRCVNKKVTLDSASPSRALDSNRHPEPAALFFWTHSRISSEARVGGHAVFCSRFHAAEMLNLDLSQHLCAIPSRNGH